MIFQKTLAFGQVAEGRIAKWLRARGHTIIPVYDLELETGKGPQIFSPVSAFIAPDMLAVDSRGTVRFFEAKHKSVFTWYRKGRRWTTGIDLRHYEDYWKVQEHFRWDVWLLFLHEQATPDPRDLKHPGCPRKCPVGLFGGQLRELVLTESHRSDRWGKTGMVYWARDSLRLLAPLERMP